LLHKPYTELRNEPLGYYSDNSFFDWQGKEEKSLSLSEAKEWGRKSFLPMRIKLSTNMDNNKNEVEKTTS
jgi:hypothetical protein